jgi:hypothetical protein
MREDRLSPAQRKVLTAQREPWRHAYERLRERHIPEADYETLKILATLAMGAITMGGRNLTSRVIKEETPESVIVEVRAFTDLKPILVVMNPRTGIPRTILP